MDRISVSGPWITDKEIEYIKDAAANAWYQNANMYHERFEKTFTEYIGTKYAMALPSCTSAIHLALLALDIKKGDEVIVPELTWIATSAPIDYVGATPIFADVDKKTWCLCADSFESLINKKTKAVIPVDLYGNVPDMDKIRDIARFYNIPVIEDAAEAIGTKYKERQAGSLGDIGVFSFHGSKTLTTGEGGMLVTNDEEIYRRCLFLRDHGRASGTKMFWNSEVAYKYKISSLQAALGLAQIERVEELVECKRQIFSWYQEELKDISCIILNYEAPEVRNTYWMVTAIIDSNLNILKEAVIQHLTTHNIDSRPVFYPLSSLPAYSKYEQAQKAKIRNHMSYNISPYGVNLPSGMTITRSEVKRICEVFIKVLGI